MKRDLNALCDKEFDLLIVGSGIYGATAAWDATLRGLDVAIIDQGDFGWATSANSLKIVHGGLRYLQTLDVERMRQSIRERRTYLLIAPHLVHPLPCVMPTYGMGMKSKHVMLGAMLMNDIISFDRNRLPDPQKTIPMGRTISKRECLRLIPGISPDRVTGGALWTDAQIYSTERLLLAFVQSAVRDGAVAANYVKASQFLKSGELVNGVQATDTLTGNTFDIRAKVVVNAAGGWIDKMHPPCPNKPKRFPLSTAMNLVVNRPLLPECAAGVSAPFQAKRSDGTINNGRHILFMTPWNGSTVIGTYHRPYEGDPDDCRVTEAEVQDFLQEINAGFPNDPIQRDEVTFFHKGFLPMDGINPKTGEVAITHHSKIHDHEKEEGIKGLISLAGVKYTTARDVSEKAVNLTFEKLGKSKPTPDSRNTRIAGGEVDSFPEFLRSFQKHHPDLPERLVYMYGNYVDRVLAHGKENPDWFKPLPGRIPVLPVEVVHAVRVEMSQKLSDVILRRTDLGAQGPPEEGALNAVADLMAKEMGWDKSRKKGEIEQLRAVYQTVE